MTERALVLGAGFLGAHIGAALSAAGRQVTVAARSHPSADREPLLTGCDWVPLELGVASAEPDGRLRSLVDRADLVVFAVGSLYPAESQHQPALDLFSSLPPFLATLDAVSRTSSRLILISSGGTVYGDHGAVPLAEAACREPLSAYGITKLVQEQYVELARRAEAVAAISVRVANAYGPTQASGRGQGAVAAFLRAAATGEPVPLFGDTVRDYVHVEDVADAVARLSRLSSWPSAVNIGTGVGTSLTALRSQTERVTGRQVPWFGEPSRPGDLPYNVLDCGLARELLDWRPRPLEEGLSQTWASFRARP